MPARCTTAAVALAALLGAASTAAAPPAGWTRARRAAPDARVRLSVALRTPEEGRAALTAALYAVSDPASPSYGRHLSKAAVDALTAPTVESVAAVEAWLAALGADGVAWGPSREWASGDVAVAALEAALDTTYHVYVTQSGHSVIRSLADYALPAAVAAAVDFVGPTSRFPPAAMVPRLHTAFATTTGLRGGAAAAAVERRLQADGTTPDSLRALYGVGTTAVKNASTAQVATGYLGEYASPADLATFLKAFYPAAEGAALTVVGPNDAKNPGLEASLDVQYIVAMAAGAVNSTFWYTPGTRPGDNEPYAVFLQNFSALPDAAIPKVLSTSYGDSEDTVDYAYASRVGLEFQKLGARGVTVLFSSGDGGVSGSQGGRQCKQFVPVFPAALPWVTGIGATQGSGPETAASFSGGGFSNYWPRSDAPYQAAAVSAYLSNTTGLPPASRYNGTAGAGFPDIAVAGVAFNIVVGGETMQVDGTSCSTPTFAGIVSLLNDARSAVGKGSLGWLNPLLYANPGAFTDITEGNNPGCGTQGFPARAGWDPVTGLGTPKFPALLALALAQP